MDKQTVLHFSGASFSKADLIPILPSSSTSSPLWCICSRISQPPTNSPSKKTSTKDNDNVYFVQKPMIETWGIVGQLLYSLMPCLMSSSARTL